MHFINAIRRNRKARPRRCTDDIAVGAIAPAAQADYQLVARHSGKCLDVAYASQCNGANVGRYSCNGGYNQQFRLSSTDPGFFKLVARHSGKCVDVQYGSRSDGANIQQMTCAYGYNQQFSLRSTEYSYYQIVARHSDACLDVEWGACGMAPTCTSGAATATPTSSSASSGGSAPPAHGKHDLGRARISRGLSSFAATAP